MVAIANFGCGSLLELYPCLGTELFVSYLGVLLSVTNLVCDILSLFIRFSEVRESKAVPEGNCANAQYSRVLCFFTGGGSEKEGAKCKDAEQGGGAVAGELEQ